MWYLAGLVQPAQALALLAEEHQIPGKKPRASFLNTYPSYLGELVECGLAAGYLAGRFRAGTHLGGGRGRHGRAQGACCQQLFGAVIFVEGFGMTEVWPLGATRCVAGHLHWEPLHGLVEVLRLDALPGPAQPGEVGTLVATPFAPYREARRGCCATTPKMSSNPLPGRSPAGCAIGPPRPTSGKLRLSVRHDRDGWTRANVLEALEAAEEDVPLPARVVLVRLGLASWWKLSCGPPRPRRAGGSRMLWRVRACPCASCTW